MKLEVIQKLKNLFEAASHHKNSERNQENFKTKIQ